MKLFFAVCGFIMLSGADTPKVGWAFVMLGIVCFGAMLSIENKQQKKSG